MHLHHDADAQAEVEAPPGVDGLYLCSIDAEPFLLLPGANMFIAQEDLSRAEPPGGGNAIHCQPISEVKGAQTTSKGWNYLRRILAGIASA